jgi:hypothetical protein
MHDLILNTRVPVEEGSLGRTILSFGYTSWTCLVNGIQMRHQLYYHHPASYGP